MTLAWLGMAEIYRESEREAKLIRKLPAHGVPLMYFKDTT